MSRSATSDAVNEAVEAVRTQVSYLRATQKERPLLPIEVEELVALSQLLAQVENNRAGWVIAMIAGRRGLDKVPASEMDLLLSAIAGPDVPAPVAEVPPAPPPTKARRRPPSQK